MLIAADSGVARCARAACDRRRVRAAADDFGMAATGRAQQRGTTLAVDRVDRKAELQQALYCIEVAGDRRCRQVHRCSGRRARASCAIRAVGKLVAAAGEHAAERGLAVGRTRLRQGAGADQHAPAGSRRARRQRGWRCGRGHHAGGSAPCASALRPGVASRAGSPSAAAPRGAGDTEGIGAALERLSAACSAPREVCSPRWQPARNGPGRPGRQPAGHVRAAAGAR